MSKYRNKMWEGAISARPKQICNYNLHLFCTFWYNLEQMIKSPSISFSFAKKTFGIMQFFIIVKLLSAE